MASNQNSIISYVPQSYFTEGSSTIVNQSNVASIVNAAGIFDPDLSNYVTINPTNGVSAFAVKIDFPKQGSHLTTYNMTLGFIGCNLLTYEDDGFGSPDLTTEFTENINCSMTSNITAESEEIAKNTVDKMCNELRIFNPITQNLTILKVTKQN